MEIDLGTDAAATAAYRHKKPEIVRLVHQHLGHASVVTVTRTQEGVALETARGRILVDASLSYRVDT